MILSCVALKYPYPIRLAGTWKAYSGSAISQLTRITLQSGNPRNRRWPYQAMVMNVFEQMSSRTVHMRGDSENDAAGAQRPRPAGDGLTRLFGDLDLGVRVGLHLFDHRLPKP